LTTLERRIYNESAKVNPQTQYYRCHRYEHLASQCPSQNKILLVEVFIEDVEEHNLKVIVHQQDDDPDASAEECKFNGCIKAVRVMNQTLSVEEPN